MTSEIELIGKDSVKLKILKDVFSGKINISLSLDGGNHQDFLSQIHREGSRMQVLGKFNLSEDPTGEILTVRPITVSDSLKIAFGFSGTALPNESKLSIFRSASKSIEREFDINDTLRYVEFIPQGSKYLIRLTYDEPESRVQPLSGSNDGMEPVSDGITGNASVQENSPVLDFASLDDFDAPDVQTPTQHSNPQSAPIADSQTPQPAAAVGGESRSEENAIQGEVQAAENQLKQLRERRESAKELLNKLEKEYQKDYEAFEKELEEIKNEFGVDQSVIDYYKDNDIVPIEELLKEAATKLAQAEKQISVVILSRQSKTMEIENEIKSNKRQ